jgi:hypothetical protein
MRHHTLGPAIRSFGPNIKITLVLIGLGAFFSWFFFVAAREFQDGIVWAVDYFVGAAFGLLLVRHLAFRLWVHESGISYRGILGHGEIRWRDLDRIYFGSYDINVHYLPLGTFYRLRLIAKHGEKLSIGERLHGAGDLAELIHSYTLPEMLRKATHEFANGQVLDFGAVRLSRRGGVVYRKWFAWREIRWKDLESYGTTDSHFRVQDFKKWFGRNISAEKVANIHVLEAMLDDIRKRGMNP